jgi:hypothetical protein
MYTAATDPEGTVTPHSAGDTIRPKIGTDCACAKNQASSSGDSLCIQLTNVAALTLQRLGALSFKSTGAQNLRSLTFVGFEVFAAVTMKNTVSLDI